jgi:hypothetical protein
MSKKVLNCLTQKMSNQSLIHIYLFASELEQQDEQISTHRLFSCRYHLLVLC